MKIIKNAENQSTVILEDGDVLNVTSLQENGSKITIQCFDSILHVDEISMKEIENLKMEKEAIQAMEDYLKDENKE